MNRRLPVLHSHMTNDEIREVCKEFPNWQYEVPLVSKKDFDGYSHSPSRSDVGEVSLYLVGAVEALPSQKAIDKTVVPTAAQLAQPMSPLLATPEFNVRDMDAAVWPLDESKVTVPLQVPPNIPIKDLLPLFDHMHKSVAFVTFKGRLIGAVSLTDLYNVLKMSPEERPNNRRASRLSLMQ